MDERGTLRRPGSVGAGGSPIGATPGEHGWALPPVQRVHVIVNPAAGRNRPVLSILNDVFLPADIDWDVSITRPNASTRDLALRALDRGIDALAVYGGDGTIMDVAAALLGSETPLVILPGGTANALAVSLNIPTGLGEAAALLTSGDGWVRAIDIGEVNGRHFLVAVGLGIPGAWAAAADREEKDRYGTLAYLARSLQALGQAKPSDYRLMLDGAEVVSSGVTCIIANSGGFGLPGIHLAPTIHVDDGLLDVIIIRDTDIVSIVSLAASVLQREDAARTPPRPTAAFEADVGPHRRDATPAPLQHWQTREVYLVADPPQAVQADGEVLDPGPITARVHHHGVRVLVPAPRRPPEAWPIGRPGLPI